jgi:hypothetical protein
MRPRGIVGSRTDGVDISYRQIVGPARKQAGAQTACSKDD